MQLNTTGTCPPGGYRFFVSATGTWVPDPTVRRGSGHLAMGDLLGELRAHYKANRADAPPDLQALVEDQMCRNLPGGWCSEHGIPVHGAQGEGWAMDFTRVKQGTETLLRWVISGGGYCDQPEAERRAAICAKCPQNTAIIGCSSCSMPSLNAVIESVRLGRHTSQDAVLQGCTVCGCSLRAKVWLPMGVLRSSTPGEQLSRFPSHCWMLASNDPKGK